MADDVELRFFIDHGMIHDRDTGKHVSTEPVEYEEGKFDTSPIEEACALLNTLAARTPSPVSVEEVARAIVLMRLATISTKPSRRRPSGLSSGEASRSAV